MLDLTVGGPTANTPTILWLKALQRLYEWDATKLQAITGKLEQLPLGFPETIGEHDEVGSMRACADADIQAALSAGVYHAMRRNLNEHVGQEPFKFSKPEVPAAGPEVNAQKHNTSNNPNGNSDPNFHVPSMLPLDYELDVLPECITTGVVCSDESKALADKPMETLASNCLKYVIRVAGVVHPNKSGPQVALFYEKLISLIALKYHAISAKDLAKFQSTINYYKATLKHKFTNFRNANKPGKSGNNQVVWFGESDINSPEVQQLIAAGIFTIKLDSSLSLFHALPVAAPPPPAGTGHDENPHPPAPGDEPAPARPGAPAGGLGGGLGGGLDGGSDALSRQYAARHGTGNLDEVAETATADADAVAKEVAEAAAREKAAVAAAAAAAAKDPPAPPPPPAKRRRSKKAPALGDGDENTGQGQQKRSKATPFPKFSESKAAETFQATASLELVVGDAFAATFDVDGVATWAVGTITEVLLNWVDANFSDGSSWVPINGGHGKTWLGVKAIA